MDTTRWQGGTSKRGHSAFPIALSALELDSKGLKSHEFAQMRRKSRVSPFAFLTNASLPPGVIPFGNSDLRGDVVTKRSDNLAAAVHRNADGAIERLIRLYQDALFSYALRLLRDRFDAQEVTQDAFVRAIRALTLRYDEDKCRSLELKPWLFRITRNLVYSRRKLRRHSVEVPLLETDDGPPPAFQSQPKADRVLEAQEQEALMMRALARLNREARDLVLLRFMEELSYAEIAAAVNASESSVRGKVFRALQALRAALKRAENRNAM